jgi:hypothetical protein
MQADGIMITGMQDIKIPVSVFNYKFVAYSRLVTMNIDEQMMGVIMQDSLNFSFLQPQL